MPPASLVTDPGQGTLGPPAALATENKENPLFFEAFMLCNYNTSSVSPRPVLAPLQLRRLTVPTVRFRLRTHRHPSEQRILNLGKF